MTRGFCKKIYHVKNTGSKYFEEAYLILKSDTEVSSEPTLAEEADRIIREASLKVTPAKSSAATPLSRALSFAMGVFTSGLAIGIVALLITLG